MSDATLIKGARELAAAKGTGGAGIEAIGKGIKAAGTTVAKAMAPDKNGKIGPDGRPKNSDAELRRLEKKLKANDFKAVELDGFTLEGRDKVEAELSRMNKALDEAETILYMSDINSEEYEKAYKQKNRVMSEYKAFVKAGKTLRDFRANERNILGHTLAENGDNIRGGYSRVSLNAANIDKTRMLIEDKWVWDSEEMDFVWDYQGKEKLSLSNRSDYKPMTFDQVADITVYLQKQKIEATKQINPQKRVAMHQALTGELRTAFLENKYGPHMLEAFLGNAELPEFNTVFEELDINFTDKNVSAQERIKSFKENGEAAINILADAVFPEMNPPVTKKEKEATLTKTQKDKNTTVYEAFKDVTNENPRLKVDSVPILLSDNSYLTWIAAAELWVITDKDGTPRTDKEAQTFPSLDEALRYRGFSSVTE